jgi:thymidylate synthase ThyX
MINAKILLDSVNPCGNRILTYPRFFHSELMTHRVFSRNAASSRAIPVKRMIEDIKNDPAMPIFWGKNQSGMQAKEELDDILKNREIFTSPVGNSVDPCKLNVTAKQAAKHEWLAARDSAIKHAERMLELGLHKQIANRILEPFMHMTVLVTATEFENFFSLRAHPDAQPEFQDLAYKMLDLYQSNEPQKLKEGEWHIPFGDKLNEEIVWALANKERDLRAMSNTADEEIVNLQKQTIKLKIATARCARTSYLNFEGKDDYNKDIELHDILANSGHWSPFEHSAKALSKPTQSGNFVGWEQYRKQFKNENRTDGRVQRQS